jgi:hypothetical protein
VRPTSRGSCRFPGRLAVRRAAWFRPASRLTSPPCSHSPAEAGHYVLHRNEKRAKFLVLGTKKGTPWKSVP